MADDDTRALLHDTFGADALRLGEEAHAANLARDPAWCGSLTGAVATAASLLHSHHLTPRGPDGDVYTTTEVSILITDCPNPRAIGRREVLRRNELRRAPLDFAQKVRVPELAKMGTTAVVETRAVTTIRGHWEEAPSG